MKTRYLRFDDLKSSRIVNNRQTLYRWIKRHNFPEGILIGPNTRVWSQADVIAWVESRKERKNDNLSN